MTRTILNFFLLIVTLVLAQAVIFNNLILFNCAVAFVFIFPIIVMPMTLSTNKAVTIAFLIGMSVDILSNTQGMNALACTILGFVRRPIFHLYVSNDEDLTGMRVSSRNMDMAAFLKYMGTMTLIYSILIYIIDAFSFFDIGRLAARIVCSWVFTFIILYAFDSFSIKRREKKL